MIKSVEEIVEGIHHIRFKSQQLMNISLLRMQEFSEHHHFKDKRFTIDEYIEWSINNNGKFEYLDQIVGSNFPLSTMKPFRDGEFSPLNGFERTVLDATQGLKGYLIGTYRGRELTHELAHGLFHNKAEYRRKVIDVIKHISTDNRLIMQRDLEDKGYHKSVWLSEINSYIVDGTFRPRQRNKIVGLFKSYSGKNL